MRKNRLVEEINRLKKEKRAVILAHNYQPDEIQDLADFVGDSLELSRKAAEVEADIIVFCGVHFMAETAKILAPGKKVLLPDLRARCPMADMVRGDDLRWMKEQHPGKKVVAYVNTTAEVKAETDVCCTSANAVQVVSSLPEAEIIFVPDRNLAHYVSQKTGKKLHLWDGYCPIHEEIKPKHIERMKKRHPGAEVWAHPECRPEVLLLADRILSTGQMIREAPKSEAREIIVATEVGILHRLRKENPDQKFYPAREKAVCRNMKRINLKKVYKTLLLEEPEVVVEPGLADRAREAINQMMLFI
ncbi:MAG: quinolinate synthase NadA [Candidatus Saccharicenans sp.]|jgi:quinolinate synthase|nr:quinolinate synthase NadA [Candidatus Saccharicenans sp.]MDH7493115.1 quinolinate synthase NadA [Candidatus Saccharicenans sp.]